MFDVTDEKILNLLQENGRISNADIARQIGLAPSAVLERIRKLEERGVIQGYGARVCPKAAGYGLLAYVLVRSDERVGGDRTPAALAEIPEVLELHHIAGEDCYLMKVRARDTDHLGELLRERVGTIETVRSTKTTIVLKTIKESASVPLRPAAAAAKGKKA